MRYYAATIADIARSGKRFLPVDLDADAQGFLIMFVRMCRSNDRECLHHQDLGTERVSLAQPEKSLVLVRTEW